MQLGDLLTESLIQEIEDSIQNGLSHEQIHASINNELRFQKDVAVGKPLFGYMGGKARLAPQILPYIPTHTIYVEPFCGSCSVLLAKGYPKVTSQEQYREVINDINGNLIQFLRVLQTKPNELLSILDQFWYSEEIFKDSHTKKEKFQDCDSIHRAALYFYNILSAFASRENGGFAFSKKGGNNPAKMLNKIAMIKSYHERMKKVYIFHRDYKDLISRFDTPKTFFYLDPPYFGLKGRYYQYQNLNPAEFISTLKQIEGQWILSHYYNEFIEENFSEYPIVHLKHTVSAVKIPNRSEFKCDECLVFGNCTPK